MKEKFWKNIISLEMIFRYIYGILVTVIKNYRPMMPRMNFIVFLGNDSNLLIVFYVQIMPDDFVMQLHRF